MNGMSFILIFTSVTLSVLAQLLLRSGMASQTVQGAMNKHWLDSVLAIATNSYVIGGLFAYVASAAVWLGVLSKVEVSKAYPFVGLGFVGTMLGAYFLLNEPLTATKIIGTVLIVLGVITLSR